MKHKHTIPTHEQALNNTPLLHNKQAIFLVCGLSGAGKSTALQVFEDMNFFTADGLPPSIIPEFTRLVKKPEMQHFKGIALGLDMRADMRADMHANMYADIHQKMDTSLIVDTKLDIALNTSINENRRNSANNDVIHKNMHHIIHDVMQINNQSLLDEKQQNTSKNQNNITPTIIFLDANNQSIIKRYASTRRPHPLEREGLTLESAIIKERNNLDIFKHHADIVIDTSNFTLHDLRRALQHRFNDTHSTLSCMHINLISFGFKYGLPQEADMVFDMRFLPNPYFIEELRPFSGLDTKIIDYVFDTEKAQEFRYKFLEYLCFMIPYYRDEGRYKICIAIGCTGGRHRSVAVAEFIYKELISTGHTVTLEHKHLKNDSY